MPELSASPRAARLAAPGWLDGRLVVGVLLVLVSVVVGARVLGRGDARQPVWTASHDLAAGTTLAAGDLARAQVRLDDRGDRYLLADGAPPVGYVLQRGVGPGELVPRASLVRPDAVAGGRREVAVPVTPGHLPEDLQPGQQVDVYVTPQRAAPTAASPEPAPGTRLVLSRVTVTSRSRPAGLAGGGQGVVLSVAEAEAVPLVAAAQAGGIDLVRVPRADQLPALRAPVPAAAAQGAG